MASKKKKSKSIKKLSHKFIDSCLERYFAHMKNTLMIEGSYSLCDLIDAFCEGSHEYYEYPDLNSDLLEFAVAKYVPHINRQISVVGDPSGEGMDYIINVKASVYPFDESSLAALPPKYSYTVLNGGG